jgi:Glycosyltransferase
VIGEARCAFPECDFVVIGTRVDVPYEDIEDVAAGSVYWIPTAEPMTWSDLGEPPPDVFVITSWAHRSFMSLAREARRVNSAMVVCMVDNYFYGTLKQLLGLVYFRLRLRRLFDVMWVPGVRGGRFMRMLGMPSTRIETGLYSADTDIFFSLDDGEDRSEILFVGQFIARKGIPNILDAYHVLDEPERIQLRLIGHGPLRSDVAASGVRYDDFKQPSELGKLYRQASALLIPSKMDHWGMVGHEAALSGCLILASKRCAFVDDLVEHRVNGFIMETGASSEIVAAIRWLRGLSREAEMAGRAVSIAKADAISPQAWAATLGRLIDRQVDAMN